MKWLSGNGRAECVEAQTPKPVVGAVNDPANDAIREGARGLLWCLSHRLHCAVRPQSHQSTWIDCDDLKPLVELLRQATGTLLDDWGDANEVQEDFEKVGISAELLEELGWSWEYFVGALEARTGKRFRYQLVEPVVSREDKRRDYLMLGYEKRFATLGPRGWLRKKCWQVVGD